MCTSGTPVRANMATMSALLAPFSGLMNFRTTTPLCLNPLMRTEYSVPSMTTVFGRGAVVGGFVVVEAEAEVGPGSVLEHHLHGEIHVELVLRHPLDREVLV